MLRPAAVEQADVRGDITYSLENGIQELHHKDFAPAAVSTNTGWNEHMSSLTCHYPENVGDSPPGMAKTRDDATIERCEFIYISEKERRGGVAYPINGPLS